MKLFRLTAAIGLGLSFIGSAAIASTIGSLNSTRTYGAYQLDGGNYDDIRNAILGDGHTVVAGTSAVNGGYLSGLDVFYTGMIDTAAGVSEILALQSFVSAGGTLVIYDKKRIDPDLKKRIEIAARPPKTPGRLARLLGQGKRTPLDDVTAGNGHVKFDD